MFVQRSAVASLVVLIFLFAFPSSWARTYPDPYDWSADPKAQWIDSGSSNISCHPWCSVSFFSLNGTLFAHGRSRQIPGTNTWSGAGIWQWTGISWTRIMNNTEYGISRPICTDRFCYTTHLGDLFRFNPLEPNATRRRYESLPDPPVFPNFWTERKVSGNFYVDPFDRYIWFLGGVSGHQVLRLDLQNNFTYTLLRSDPMPPTFGGGTQHIVATLNLDVYTKTAFGYAVFRWSNTLQKWHNVTYNMDVRNQLGNCCGPLGDLVTNGHDIYQSGEQGTFYFRGDEWQKVTNHWGNVDVYLTNKFLFEQDSRWELPGPVSAIPFGKESRRYRRIHSPNGGKTLFAVVERYNSTSDDWDTFQIQRYVFPERTEAGFFEVPTRSHNFNLELGSYIGTDQDDEATGAAIGKDSNGNEVVVLGANFPLPNPSIASSVPATINVAFGNATSRGHLIIRRADAQSTVIRVARVGLNLEDVAVSRNESAWIAVATSEGVAVLDRSASTIVWSLKLVDRSAYKIAIDEIGNVAVLTMLKNSTFTKWLHVFNLQGAEISSRDVTTNGVFDVEITSQHGGIVWISGYAQIHPILQRPMLRAFSVSTMQQLYSLWFFSFETLSATNNMADCRVSQLHYGLDGRLYFLGESAGANSVFRYNGFDLSTSSLISTDAYTTPFNTNGAAHLMYYARADPPTGTILAGQYRFPRLSTGFRANTMRSSAAALSVNARGEMFVAGVAACCIPGREMNRVGCNKVGTYSAGDSYLLILASDFSGPLLWTPLNKQGGTGAGRGIAVGQTIAAAWFHSEPKEDQPINLLHTTDSAPFKTRFGLGNSTDLWYGVWNLQQSLANCTAQVLADTPVYNNPDKPTRNPFTEISRPAPPAVPADAPFATGEISYNAGISGGGIAAIVVVVLLLAVIGAVVAILLLKPDLRASLREKLPGRRT